MGKIPSSEDKQKKNLRSRHFSQKGKKLAGVGGLGGGEQTYRREGPGFLEVPEGGSGLKVALSQGAICTTGAAALEPHTLEGVLSASYVRPSHLECRVPM